MRNKSSQNEDVLPIIIKRKLERLKIECRLMNRKESNFENYLTVRPNESITNKKIKVTLEILNYTDLKIKPVIPRYGRFLTDILQIVEIDVKGIDSHKSGILTYNIKAPEVDQYCYPLLFNNDNWRIAEHFTIESDEISISEGNWSAAVLVKEPVNEIISITTNGGMIYSELDKITCLRVPKGTFKENKYCKIQFVNILGCLDDFKAVYEEQLMPFCHLSEIFVAQLVDNNRDLTNDQKSLRRTVSIKIPLPDWVISSLSDINFDTKKVVQNQKQEKLGFYFLQKIGDNWNFFDGNLQFTQNSLSFETKDLGCFTFVKCRENREIRLCPHMSLVENLYISERGVVLTFLWIKSRQWFIWIEIVPINKILSTREYLLNNGLLYIEQSFEYPVEEDNGKGHRYGQKNSKKAVILRKTIELYEGIQFKLSLSGHVEKNDSFCKKKSDVKSSSNTRTEENNLEKVIDLESIGKRKKIVLEGDEEYTKVIEPDLSYHKNSYHSNAVLVPIKPIDKPIDEWTSIIIQNLNKRSVSNNIEPTSTNNEAIDIPPTSFGQTDIDTSLIELNADESFISSKLSLKEKEYSFQCDMQLDVTNCSTDLVVIPSQKFTFYIPLDVMKEYFKVMTKDELHAMELERLRIETEDAAKLNQEKLDKTIPNEPNKIRTVNYNRIQVLSNPRTKIKDIERYPKIVSIKSMQALSNVVRQGLTLAVYLSLPENVIAGIGFDSLSQISMNGVNSTTYKVLITWKKMIHLNKIPENVYVEQLLEALKMLGYGNLSTLIQDHWKNNQEITMDDCNRCLLTVDPK